MTNFKDKQTGEKAMGEFKDLMNLICDLMMLPSLSKKIKHVTDSEDNPNSMVPLRLNLEALSNAIVGLGYIAPTLAYEGIACYDGEDDIVTDGIVLTSPEVDGVEVAVVRSYDIAENAPECWVEIRDVGNQLIYTVPVISDYQGGNIATALMICAANLNVETILHGNYELIDSWEVYSGRRYSQVPRYDIYQPGTLMLVSLHEHMNRSMGIRYIDDKEHITNTSIYEVE